MGCAGSRPKGDDSSKKIRKPKPWKHPEAITRTQLMKMREEFWDTAPHYGGRQEIWDALHAAAEADLTLAQAIVDSAGVIVQRADLTICYDERGAMFIYSPSPPPASRPPPPRNLFHVYRPFQHLIHAMLIVAGAKYELPKYVLSEPTNLIDDN